MKRLLVLCLLVLSACNGCAARQAGGTLDRAELWEMRDRTVQVNVECEDYTSSGSGVVVGPDGFDTIIATAAHVPDAGCEARIGGRLAEVVAHDADADVALLRVHRRTSYGPLQLAENYLGQPVLALGYPHQFLTDEVGFQVTRGYLVADYGNRLRVSASFYFGSSGGPAFDEDGALVGLTVSGVMTLDQLAQQWVPIADQYIVTPGDRVLSMYEDL